MNPTKGGADVRNVEATNNPIDDDDQASLVIQREVGMALRQSFKAATREPLPQQIALLLLRLALAESLQTAVEEDENKGEGPLGRRKGVVRRWLYSFFANPSFSKARGRTRTPATQPTADIEADCATPLREPPRLTGLDA